MSEISIVSYNLRCIWDKYDGINSFINRAGTVLEKIDKTKPDIICFQECIRKQCDFFRKYLSDYTIIYNQRKADYSGEGLAVALKKDVIELYGLDVFWLSDTPRVPGSRFEIQSECPRICQSLTVYDRRQSKMLKVYNVHLDHVSDEARLLGIKQLLNYAVNREETSMPLFILGDFNALPGSKTIEYCDNFDALPIVDLTRETGGTFHAFGNVENDPAYATPIKIDYIYADKETAQKPHSVELWKDENNGIYLSDHYPVSLKIEL